MHRSWKSTVMFFMIASDSECILTINIHVISSETMTVTSGTVFKKKKKIRNFCYEKKNENHKSDWNSCNYFKADGSDNGYTSYIKNHFDWHVMFVGQYSVGDISYVGLKSVNNAHG